jgi:hypothetical protein
MDNCRDVKPERARTNRITGNISQVKLGWRSGVWKITEVAHETAQTEQSSQAKQGMGGKFYKVASGKIGSFIHFCSCDVFVGKNI